MKKCLYCCNKQVFTIILLIVLLLSLFAACNNKTSEDNMKFTFEKVNDRSLIASTHYLMDFGDIYSGEDNAIIEGKLLTVFGEPLTLSDDEENGYEYVIKATAENGETTYISVYHAAGAHIGGDGFDTSVDAAKALIEYVNSANPSDFQRVRYYMDFGVEITTTVKNGVVHMESRFLNEAEIKEVYSRWYGN